ncbi:hypothetical protein AAMO2058_001398800 [Amorphochlora amoebiformis]
MAKDKVEEKDKKEEAKETKTKEPEPVPRTALDELEDAVFAIAKGVKAHQNEPIARSVRKMNMLRKKLTKAQILKALDKYVPKSDNRAELSDYVKLVEDSMEIEGESVETSAPASMDVEDQKSSLDDYELLPEVKVYLRLLVIVFLLDNGKKKEVTNVAESSLEFIKKYNKRTMDLISARVYFYYSLAHMSLGNPVSIRNKLLSMYRSACLVHDVPGQAVLQNAILANYLFYNMYGQAEMFSKMATRIEKDNNQYARYLYYIGKINAVRLHYSDADENLSQALRKCPKSAIGFRQVATKLLCIVQLLMGDVPERSMFLDIDLKRSLYPYFKLTQAVRIGSLEAFSEIVAKFSPVFKQDGMSSLITRLRHNVIKTGLRKICLSYSHISLKSICEKLKYDSVEDIEYIVAKAIHDGVINASINRKSGTVTSQEKFDVYSSDEPSKVFNKRINFCLKLRNEAVKAMQYPPDAHKPKRELEETEEKDEEKEKEKDEKKDKGKKKK